MKYPMYFDFKPELNHPYQFRFDLVEPGPIPREQIADIRYTVNTWLTEAGIEYVYRAGLIWCLVNERDAMIFKLRFA